jgi:hypothetical protein
LISITKIIMANDAFPETCDRQSSLEALRLSIGIEPAGSLSSDPTKWVCRNADAYCRSKFKRSKPALRSFSRSAAVLSDSVAVTNSPNVRS